MFVPVTKTFFYPVRFNTLLSPGPSILSHPFPTKLEVTFLPEVGTCGVFTVAAIMYQL